MKITVVGDTLLDRDEVGEVDRLSPDAPVPVLDASQAVERPGGAGLAALLAAHDGTEVTLVTALAADEPGQRLRSLLEAGGVEVVDLGTPGRTVEKIRFRTSRQALLRVDRGGRRSSADGPIGPLSASARQALSGADGILVADYGHGLASAGDVREALTEGLDTRPLVWDPHPNGPEPVPGAWIVCPNAAEARRAHGSPGARSAAGAAAAMAAALRNRWQARAVAVTCGAAGAVLAGPAGAPLVLPCPFDAPDDPCGAGDRFAVTALAALCRRATPAEAVGAAVDAAAWFIASGGVAALFDPRSSSGAPLTSARPAAGARAAWGMDATLERIRPVRRRGGVVVAAGGCFDLLHPGHVRLLQEARRLGDALVVLINSDASARRLKGPGRPVQDQAARAAVLGALDAVDAVAAFDDDTPIPALDLLRPDLFVKGGDYEAAELPEAAALRRWGGEVVILPYLPGHSTSRLVLEASRGS